MIRPTAFALVCIFATSAIAGANEPTAIRLLLAKRGDHIQVATGYTAMVTLRLGSCILRIRGDASHYRDFPPEQDIRGLMINGGEALGNASDSSCVLSIVYYLAAANTSARLQRF